MGSPATENDARREAGLGLTILFCIFAFISGRRLFSGAALLFAVLTAAVPSVFGFLVKPFALLRDFAARLISSIALGVIFVLVVLPVALLRRAAGHDELRLRSGKGSGSAFSVRKNAFDAADMEDPF